MKVIKRSGQEVEFDSDKIFNAIFKANKEVVEKDGLSKEEIKQMTERVELSCIEMGRTPTVEEIQDIVERHLVAINKYYLAKKYILYRYDRQLKREKNTIDDVVMSIVEYDNEEIKQENSNKNPEIAPTQRDYLAGEISKDISRRYLIPEDIIKAHDEGIIHFHDMDYFLQHIYNCCLVAVGDMLTNGTVISNTMIDTPHKFSTACNVSTQVSAQVASSQYGGQSMSLAQLTPFIAATRKKAKQLFAHIKPVVTEEQWNELIEAYVQEDIAGGIQTIQYQILTLMTTNGQTPFITIYLDINEIPDEDEEGKADLARAIEEMLKQRIKGVKNEKGVYITPAFPKLIYCLDENNVRPGSKYYYLTELAAKCTAKRMVPDYISAKIMRELKEGNVYTCMGCRSFLTPYTDPKTNKPKFYGRFNQGVVTISLPDVALSSGGDMDKFWEILEDRLENLCFRALMLRHKRLEGTPSDIAPILWQHGAISRLKKGENIDSLLHNGYSTISLGYAGLTECVKYMTGSTHTAEPGTTFGLQVMQKLNDKCAEWKAKENIDFSLYGTPIESTTYKFAKCLQNRFGKIEGITDKNYITNSYHVHVTEEIDAFTKLKFESEFQRLSPGGAISYVEVPNLQNNIPAVLDLMEYMYENIMYAEINTKSDFCQVCEYEGEIEIVKDEHEKLIWKCPNCGNTDQNKMNVARRTCGLTNKMVHVKPIKLRGHPHNLSMLQRNWKR